MSDATERWLPVLGWEGLYEVSDLGRVRSLPRWSPRRNRFYGGTVRNPGRRNDHGHLGITLQHNGRTQCYWVHRLVLETFVGPCPEGMEACHGPGGPSDNRLVNLRWDTHLANVGDSISAGTFLRGSRTVQARLNEAIVRECRARHAAGEGPTALSRAYGVSLTTMWYVLHRVTWKHVD